MPLFIYFNVAFARTPVLMFCEAPCTCCLGRICILCVIDDSRPQSTRRAALRRAKKPHDRPEPRYPRQRTHKLASIRGRCGFRKHGDKRRDKRWFKRGTEERREGGGRESLYARQAFNIDRRGARAVKRTQRDAVSEAGMLSHARVNSKSVRGGGTGAGLGVSCGGCADDANVDPEPCVTDGDTAGRAGSFCAVTSRVLKTVSFPDTRKIPPPTRPAFFSSRTCFASLNDAGPGSAAAGLGSGDVESGRELMGFKRSFVGSASESMMVMGTRRRFGGAAVEDVDDTSGGATMSTGAVRCILLLSRRKIRTRRRTVLPFPLKMSSSTRSSSVLTASFFGSILSAHCRSARDKGET
jgi:hypothetical protein